MRAPRSAVLRLLGASLLLAGACARNREAAEDPAAGDARTQDVAPALAAPCGLPGAVPADWQEVKRPPGVTFRVPPNFAAALSEPWAATYRRSDAHLNVWTWDGKKWVFPPLVPGRSNRCVATVNGREVDIEVVQLDVHDATLSPRGAPIPQTTATSGGLADPVRGRPRLPVYLATATWRDQLEGQKYVYLQLRSTLRRDLEQFPTLVSAVRF